SSHLGDIEPKCRVLAQLVLPYRRGEIVVQAYNVLLSLGHLLAAAPGGAAEVEEAWRPEAVLLQENDCLHAVCARKLASVQLRLKTGDKGIRPQKEVSLSHINRLMAHQLAGLLQIRKLS
ncbi:unnamed protein product, partial [Protopolystoma xenopodis]